MFRIRPPLSNGVAVNVSPLQNDPCMLMKFVSRDKCAINAVNSATRFSWRVSLVPNLRAIVRVLLGGAMK